MGVEEWPIYDLADYEGSGSLLDLCRSLLAADQVVGKANNLARVYHEPNDDSAHNQLNTSGYLTNEESLGAKLYKSNACSNKQSCNNNSNSNQEASKINNLRSIAHTNKHPSAIGLSWKQLIERNNAEQDLSANTHRNGILQLCSSLHKAIR